MSTMQVIGYRTLLDSSKSAKLTFCCSRTIGCIGTLVTLRERRALPVVLRMLSGLDLKGRGLDLLISSC